MKKYGLAVILGCCFFVSCINTDLPDVDGMWQLKSIENAAGDVQTVDTVYYSFQAQKLFTYTQLNTMPTYSDRTMVVYGQVDFPAKDYMYIHMDPSGGGWWSFLPWHSESVTYFIRKLTSKQMILESEGEVYRFVKF